ncbi:MAG TPA: c-type cytochrome [Thermoanaerobaculia bacterium]|jgi:hypothetical protein
MRIAWSLLLLVAVGCGTAARQLASTPGPATAQQERAAAASQKSANDEVNQRFLKQFSERIAGQENQPAEQVFKNIQRLKGVPAGRLLLIMNRGYSRALGVACTHCHVEQDFASDDKRPKRAAREMMVMHRMINEQLKKMQNLEGSPEDRAINCSTCHRGAIDPMAGGG